jgi:hypothetical protein
MHGPDGIPVLRHGGVQRAATLLHVPGQAAQHADVGVGVHKNLQAHQGAQALVPQRHEPFQNHQRGRVNLIDLGSSRVGHEAITRLLDVLTRGKPLHMAQEQVVIESGRLVIVDQGPLLGA